MAEPWRNRIIGYGEEAPDQLLANPRNWRIHPKFQQDALSGVLDEVGWVQDVLVNKATGYVIDGHLRVALAISRGEPTVPVKYVELTEAEEAKVIATLDPLAALAVADSEVLADLLAQVETENEAVGELLNDLNTEAEIDLWLAELLSAGPGEGDTGRRLGKGGLVKPVIYAEDLATFEMAILATGKPHRGEAVIEICRHYLELNEAGF